jgi:hypothetical protein
VKSGARAVKRCRARAKLLPASRARPSRHSAAARGNNLRGRDKSCEVNQREGEKLNLETKRLADPHIHAAAIPTGAASDPHGARHNRRPHTSSARRPLLQQPEPADWSSIEARRPSNRLEKENNCHRLCSPPGTRTVICFTAGPQLRPAR